MRNRSKLSTRGRATLPTEIREELDVKVGDTLEYTTFENGCVVIQKKMPYDPDKQNKQAQVNAKK